MVGTTRDAKQFWCLDSAKVHSRLSVCAMEGEIFEWGDDGSRGAVMVAWERKARRGWEFLMRVDVVGERRKKSIQRGR